MYTTSNPVHATDRARPDDAAVRTAYQALRALVPERGPLSAEDVASVTSLDEPTARAALRRLESCAPDDVEPAGDGTWHVRRHSPW